MTPEHEKWMRLAIEEGELARGTTGDNPWVGCVIVSPQGELLGRGHTQGPGEDHAEIAAARSAQAHGHSVVGTTLYSTLEPCSFHGRTPACAKSIAERGVARVVIGMHDPHPRVNGEGIRILHRAGVEVIDGVCEAEVRRQLGLWVLEQHPYEALRRAPQLPAQERVARLAEIYGVDRARIEALIHPPSNASLESCLPAELRGQSSTITRVAAGLSGAGVYRVEAGGRSFVLKIAAESEPIDAWRRRLQLQRLAASANLAPAVVHVDESRRAVLSAFVVDRSFLALYGNPQTREAALVLLGRTLRRLHDLPLPPQTEVKNPRQFLGMIWSGLQGKIALPAFVSEVVQRVLAEEPPAHDRALVLSHNDVNPTNLAYDGERLLLLDWDTAGANDPLYDLAAASVFLRMDESTCQSLLSAYADRPVSSLPVGFAYNCRLMAALCGAAFLHLARHRGHAGASGEETLASTAPLGEFFQRLRSGELNIASAEGQWGFGLALVKQSATL